VVSAFPKDQPIVSSSFGQLGEDFTKGPVIRDVFPMDQPNISSSFGLLEEAITLEPPMTYEADLGKRTRGTKDPEEPKLADKRIRKEKDNIMDMDTEDLLHMARTPVPSANIQSQNPTTAPHVRFQDPETQGSSTPPKDRPEKKTYLEKTLAKDYPGAEEDIARRILTAGKMELAYGEIFAISSGVTDAFKKRISNRRLPLEPTKSAHTIRREEEEEQQDQTTHYSCPLGYVKININGQTHQALLDTGSMVNIIPSGLAHQLGLVLTAKSMRLKGIGGHHTNITGIAEEVEVIIGKVSRIVHFWVADGPVQLIIGKPFLMDVSATIKYNGTQGESLSIMNSSGQTYLVPIILPSNQKWETTLPANSATRENLEKGQDSNFFLDRKKN
jgi:hypothetical protein